MDFYFPEPPGGAMPQTLQTVLIVLLAGSTGAFLVRALVRWRSTGSALGVVLLGGGALASLNEPIIDALGLCWYPREDLISSFETIGPMPLWCFFAYMTYYGGATFLLYERAKKGLTQAQLWKIAGLFLLSEIVFEITVTQLDGYSYYGNQPIEVGGMPVYWMVVNATGFFLAAAILLRAEELFAGRRVLLAALVPPVSYGVGGLGAGWPVFSVLHTEGASDVLIEIGALATMGVGLVMTLCVFQLLASDGYLARRTSEPRPRASDNGVGSQPLEAAAAAR